MSKLIKLIILGMLLLSSGLFAGTNIIRDYPFTELKLSNEWGIWYHWKVAKQIGIDLSDYWILKDQEKLYKTNIIISTNITRIDNEIFEKNEKEIKKAGIKGFGLGAAITAGIYFVIKGIFLIATK